MPRDYDDDMDDDFYDDDEDEGTQEDEDFEDDDEIADLFDDDGGVSESGYLVLAEMDRNGLFA